MRIGNVIVVILCASFNESVRIDKTNWNISAMKVIEGTRGTCGRSGRNIPPYERFAYWWSSSRMGGVIMSVR